MKNIILFIIFIVNTFVSAESLPEPSLQTLCGDSELILAATLEEECSESFYDPPIKYLCYKFKVDDVYYGGYEKPKIKVAMPVRESYAPSDNTSGIDGLYVITKYELSEKYFLFLKPYKKGYYGRVDAMWAIKKYDSSTAQMIQKELARAQNINKAAPRTTQSDAIPTLAQCKQVEVDGFDLIHKKCEYYLDGKLVGFRGWYENGQISFEEPVKDGKLNGICKYWDMDGMLHSVENYRNGRLDGISMYWRPEYALAVIYYKDGRRHGPSLNLAGDLEFFYWIDSQMVKKSKYIKSMRKNEDCPKIYDD